MPGCRACSVVIGQSTREEFATVEPKEHSGGITGEASGGKERSGDGGGGGRERNRVVPCRSRMATVQLLRRLISSTVDCFPVPWENVCTEPLYRQTFPGPRIQPLVYVSIGAVIGSAKSHVCVPPEPGESIEESWYIRLTTATASDRTCMRLSEICRCSMRKVLRNSQDRMIFLV